DPPSDEDDRERWCAWWSSPDAPLEDEVVGDAVGGSGGAWIVPDESSPLAGTGGRAGLACPGRVAAASALTPPADSAAVTAATAVARRSRRRPWSRRATAGSWRALRIRWLGSAMQALCGRRLGVR